MKFGISGTIGKGKLTIRIDGPAAKGILFTGTSLSRERSMVSTAFAMMTQSRHQRDSVRDMARDYLFLALEAKDPEIIGALMEIASVWLAMASELEGRIVPASEIMAGCLSGRDRQMSRSVH